MTKIENQKQLDIISDGTIEFQGRKTGEALAKEEHANYRVPTHLKEGDFSITINGWNLRVKPGSVVSISQSQLEVLENYIASIG